MALLDTIVQFLPRLKGLGWLKELPNVLENLSKLKDFLKPKLLDYQQHHGLDQTGELDPVTARHVMLPRFCGCDHFPQVAGPEAAGLRQWPNGDITWTFASEVKATGGDVQQCLQTAFGTWGAIANVAPRFVAGGAEVNVDSAAIDGPLGTLAWCEMPGSGQSIRLRFDSRDKFSVNKPASPNDIWLFLVALHEFGHGLGLDHGGSNIMKPIYDPTLTVYFGDYERREMQARYGAPVPVPEPTPTPTPDPTPAPPPGKRLIVIEIEGKATSVSVPGWRCSPLAG